MTTLVDSNVILDVVTEDAEWGTGRPQCSQTAQQGRLVINPLIYAEVACGFDRIEDLDEALPPQYFTRASSLGRRLPRSPGVPVLSPTRWGRPTCYPTFSGAHAAVAGYTLLTRDRRRYKTYYPKLKPHRAVGAGTISVDSH